MDGHIRKPGVRVGGITHTQRDVRPGIHRSIGRSGYQLEQVKIRVRGLVHYFLTGSRSVRHDRLNGCLGTLAEQVAQFFLFTPNRFATR